MSTNDAVTALASAPKVKAAAAGEQGSAAVEGAMPSCSLSLFTGFSILKSVVKYRNEYK